MRTTRVLSTRVHRLQHGSTDREPTARSLRASQRLAWAHVRITTPDAVDFDDEVDVWLEQSR